MTNETFAWILIFAISALVFFAIAAIVAIRGFSDLRFLLRDTKASEDSEAEQSEDR